MISINKTLLTDLLSQPTAPFKEGYVLSFITKILDQHQIPYFLDSHQNIVLGASSLKEYQKLLRSQKESPLLVFVAHMDHPGFHGSQWVSNQLLQVKWLGGTPTEHLQGAHVWLQTEHSSPTPWVGSGRIIKSHLSATGRSIEKALLELSAPMSFKVKASSVMGGFQFRSPVWCEEDLIYTHAADDLVGCFSILTLALQYLSQKPRSGKIRKKTSPAFLGLLTRAEEVGFVGALAHLEQGHLTQAQRKVIFVSLETSRTLPGAEIGKGPIVRLGDRLTVFDSGALRGLIETAEKHLPGKFQKRIMDGGSCEATASTAYGIPSMGISIPLGNYHNQSLQGGADASAPGGPAPEFVDLKDIQGMITLCEGLITSHFNWMDPWSGKRKELEGLLKTYMKLLKHSP